MLVKCPSMFNNLTCNHNIRALTGLEQTRHAAAGARPRTHSDKVRAVACVYFGIFNNLVVDHVLTPLITQCPHFTFYPRPRTHFFLKLKYGPAPENSGRSKMRGVYATRRLQELLLERPQRVIGGL